MVDAKGAGRTEVKSDAFQDDGRFSAHDENFSPALSGSKGPEGTRSHVVMAEDPDAKEPEGPR